MSGRKNNIYTAKIGTKLQVLNDRQEILYIEKIDPISDNGSSAEAAELAALKKRERLLRLW